MSHFAVHQFLMPPFNQARCSRVFLLFTDIRPMQNVENGAQSKAFVFGSNVAVRTVHMLCCEFGVDDGTDDHYLRHCSIRNWFRLLSNIFNVTSQMCFSYQFEWRSLFTCSLSSVIIIFRRRHTNSH